jgi:hypothetical protein
VRRRGRPRRPSRSRPPWTDSASAGVRQASNSGPGSANSGSSGEG